jgi:PleD family two-component response regulator
VGAPASTWPSEAAERTDVRTSGAAVPRVLVADDQPDVIEALRLLLKSEGFRFESAGSPAAVLDAPC